MSLCVAQNLNKNLKYICLVFRINYLKSFVLFLRKCIIVFICIYSVCICIWIIALVQNVNALYRTYFPTKLLQIFQSIKTEINQYYLMKSTNKRKAKYYIYINNLHMQCKIILSFIILIENNDSFNIKTLFEIPANILMLS